jgi:O-acetyl-ADP-ribose deacetylase (regulator of RNase III)
MPVEHRTGDLFAQPDLPALAHGCNCAGAMGAGIAVLFKKRWPRMYAEYKARCTDGRFVPGDVFVWEECGSTVFNLGTEKHWRTGATLDFIERSVRAMVTEAEARKIGAVGMPRIGAGYGGLVWNDVEAVLTRACAGSAVRLVVVSLPAATR